MKVIRYIKGHMVVVLLDLGSSHNFVDIKDCFVYNCNSIKVMVADRRKMLDDFKLQSNMCALPCGIRVLMATHLRVELMGFLGTVYAIYYTG